MPYLIKDVFTVFLSFQKRENEESLRDLQKVISPNTAC